MKKWILIVMMASSSVYALDSGVNGHVAGDVIAVRTNDQVAAFCNFDKSIVMTSSDVLCVYNGKKA